MKAAKKKKRRKLWSLFEEHMTPVIVTFAICTVLVFSVVVIVIQLHGIEISSTLIEHFYKFFGFEMLALSGIKISKHVGSAFGRAEEAIDGSAPLDEEEDEPGNEDDPECDNEDKEE